jgi:hypothetical protein
MAATYTPIASITLGSDAASVTFSSIPQTYTDLVVACNVSGSRATFGGDFLAKFNGDTGLNYSNTILRGNGSAASSSRDTNGGDINYGGMSPTGNFAPTIIHIMNYANTSTYKTSLARTNDAGQSTAVCVGLWRSTAAITSILFYPGSAYVWKSGSTFNLYGILGANA